MATEKYMEHLGRIKKAVLLEPVDKVPVAFGGSAYCARAEHVVMADYIRDFSMQCDVNLKALADLGDLDATQNVIFSPYLLPGQWLSNVAVPGKELGRDEMWQVLESENVKQDDYKTILKDGFGPFLDKFLVEKCGDPEGQLKDFYPYMPKAVERFADAGIPWINSLLFITPFEFLCGGRSLEKFFVEDLYEEPELIDDVFSRIMEYTVPKYTEMLKTVRPIGVWIGGWRSSPNMLSSEMWNRFVWPYFQKYVEICVAADAIPIFHLDSCWDNQLERFHELPAKKCIMSLDSKTDIRKAHKAVGDMMCIMGDVPAELLAFGTPEKVEHYVTKLIDDIGPWGYIASSGCDVPSNAKKENVRAMCDAANLYLKR
jgi:uroporphyrinogen-III decarboxylase